MNDELMSLHEYRREMGLGDHVTDVARGSGDGALKSGKAPRKHPEEDLQIACVDYIRTRGLEEKGRCWMFHVPNEKRSLSRYEMVVRQRMGVKPGVSDLILMIPFSPPVAVELKAENRKQTANQRDFAKICYNLGWKYELVRSLEYFEEMLVRYGVVRTNEMILGGGGE